MLICGRRLCVCGIALSEEGAGFDVPLVGLLRRDCILSQDVVSFVRPFQGSCRVVWVHFPFYGGMSMTENSGGLLGVG